jgi:hypothetical protein
MDATLMEALADILADALLADLETETEEKQVVAVALVCTTCARLIARTPMSYVSSSLTPEQVETYTCVECRTEPARAAHERRVYVRSRRRFT